MIFAGDEWGLRGVNGEDSRTPMPWDRPGERDEATFAHYRALTALRRDTAALRHGGLRWLHADAETLVFARETSDEAVLVLARRAPGEPAPSPLPPTCTAAPRTYARMPPPGRRPDLPSLARRSPDLSRAPLLGVAA